MIRHAWLESGPVADLVAPKLFRADGAFITEQGFVGVVLRVDGYDVEGMSDDQRRQAVKQLLAGMGLLGDDIRLYQFITKTKSKPLVAPNCDHPEAARLLSIRTAILNQQPIYDLALHLVLVYEGAPMKVNPLRQLAPQRVVRLIRTDVERRARRLNTVVGQAIRYLATMRPVRLREAETFRFFRRLVNYTDAGVRYRGDRPLDVQVSDEHVSQKHEREGYLLVGTTPVRIRTLKTPPSYTFAAILAPLASIPCEFVIVLEWRKKPVATFRDGLHKIRRWLNQTKRRHWSNALPGADTTDQLEDEGTMAEIKQAGEVLEELAVEGYSAGECSLTMLFHGPPCAMASTEAARIIAEHDGSVFEETYNLIHAFAAIIPGNRTYNFRYLDLLNIHAADLALCFTVASGDRERPCTILETPHGMPYGLNLWHGDVGHTLIIGPTGNGKSFLMNHLILNLMRFNPRWVSVLDQGYSYWHLCRALGGNYFELGLDSGMSINPFAGELTDEHQYFLIRFLRMLIEGDDRRLNERQVADVTHAIRETYRAVRPHRRLSTFQYHLPAELRPRMDRWVEGVFRKVFGGLDDDLEMGKTMTVFELNQMKDQADLLGPVQLYCLWKMRERALRYPGLSITAADEVGEMMKDPAMANYIERYAVQARKEGGMLLLATQNVQQFVSDKMTELLIESCPTKILLPNSSASVDSSYAKAFHLNPVEVELVKGAQERQQFIVKQPRKGARVMTLNEDAETERLFSNALMTRNSSREVRSVKETH